jgi:hypothetical protein
MPYIFIAIIVTSFASGYGFAYKVSKAEIREMSESIADMNREAELQLATLTEEADKAHTEALKLNKEVVAPQPKLVIPTPLLEPMKIDTNFQTNLQTFSKWKPTEQIK